MFAHFSRKTREGQGGITADAADRLYCSDNWQFKRAHIPTDTLTESCDRDTEGSALYLSALFSVLFPPPWQSCRNQCQWISISLTCWLPFIIGGRDTFVVMLFFCGYAEMPWFVFLSPDDRWIIQNTRGWIDFSAWHPCAWTYACGHPKNWNVGWIRSSALKPSSTWLSLAQSNSKMQSLGSAHPHTHTHLRVESGKWSSLISWDFLSLFFFP